MADCERPNLDAVTVTVQQITLGESSCLILSYDYDPTLRVQRAKDGTAFLREKEIWM
ncbi:MAG: hypothetical protein OXQ31_13235 [Spirochaetaceae bacterium]|nr:hypothetical protein [Spirochaetaceae bacterium]